MECKIYCWNARGKIYLNPVFIPTAMSQHLVFGERRFGFLGKEQKNTSDLKPPLLDLSIALLFFKSRVL
jgi:hypothetical protein